MVHDKLKSRLALALAYILITLMLPFLIIWFIAYRMSYSSEIIDDVKIERSRLSKKIVSVTKMSKDNMQYELDTKIFLDSFLMFKKHIEGDVSIYLHSEMEKIKDAKKIRVRTQSELKKILEERWNASRNQGVGYIICAKSDKNLLEMRLHNDAGVWGYATFTGTHEFLEQVMQKIAVKKAQSA